MAERIELEFTGDAGEAKLSAEIIEKALQSLERTVVRLIAEMHKTMLPPSEVAKTVAGYKAVEHAAHEAGEEIRKTQASAATAITPRSVGPWAYQRYASSLYPTAHGGPSSGPSRTGADQIMDAGQMARLLREMQASVFRMPEPRPSFPGPSLPYGPEPMPPWARRQTPWWQRMGGWFDGFGGDDGGGMGGGRGRGGRGGAPGWRDLTFFDEMFAGLAPGGGRARTGALALGGLTAGSMLSGVGAAGLGAGAAGVSSIGVLAGQFAVLKTALSGLGDALGGDKEAFDELDKTSQDFVLHLRGFIPVLDEIQAKTREGLFPGVKEALDTALNERTMGVVKEGMFGIAEALGAAAVEWGKWMGSADFAGRIQSIMGASADITGIWSDTLLSLADALLVVMDAGMPLLEWMSEGVARGAEWLDTWIRGKEASGELAEALEGTKDEFELIGDVIGSVIQLAWELANVLEPLGKAILTDLVAVVRDLTEWFERNREEIQQNLIGAYEGLKNIIDTLWPIMLQLAETIYAVIEAFGGMEVAVTFLLSLSLGNAIIGVASALNVALIPALGRVALALRGHPLLVLAGALAAFGIGAAALSGDDAGGVLGRVSFPGTGTKTKAAAAGIPAGSEIEEYYYEDGEWYIVVTIVESAHGGRFTKRIKKVQRVTLGQLSKLTGTSEKALAGAIKTGDDAFGVESSGGQTLPEGRIMPGQSGYHNAPRGAFKGGARDISYSKGQAVGAPADGTITSVALNKNQNFSEGFGGYNIYLKDAVGGTYFMTHIFRPQVKAGQNVRRGQVLGYVDQQVGGGFHVHIEYSTGVVTPGSTDTSRTTPPPFDSTPETPPTKEELQRDQLSTIQMTVENADLAPGIRDDIKARRRGINRLETLLGKVDDAQLKLTIKRQIASWEDEIDRLVEELPIGKKAMGKLRGGYQDVLQDMGKLPKQVRLAMADDVDALKEMWKDALVGGINKVEAADLRKAFATVRKRAKDALMDFRRDLVRDLEAAARDLSRAFFEAFDEETRKHKTPTEILIERMNKERTEGDLQRRVDEARKQLEEAMRGTTQEGSQDAMREITARYKLGRQIEIGQLSILGGDTGVSSLMDDFLRELDGAMKAAVNLVDQEEVKNAQQALEDALYDQRMYYLELQAEQEREAYEKERDALREHLEQQMQLWVAYLSTLIMTGKLGYANALAMFQWFLDGLLTLDENGNVSSPVTGNEPELQAPDGSVGQGKPRGGGAIKMMAAGGIIERGILLGERGPELVTSLPVNWRSMAAQNLYGEGGGGDVVVQISANDELLGELLSRAIDVRVMRNTSAISARIGSDADIRSREGRI